MKGSSSIDLPGFENLVSLQFFTKLMKDNFSKQSKAYSIFRPSYPQEAFDCIMSFVRDKKSAWDCGTGNGQLAAKLAEHFEVVHATDISENQIINAVKADNLHYKVASAENSGFEENQFDLITVAQAIHWFRFDEFYAQVRKTLKPGGIIAIIGYHLPETDEKTDAVIRNLYSDILGKYWDAERRYIDERYETIPFPFDEIPVNHSFSQKVEWSLEELTGYLNTWSSVQHYIQLHGKNPVDLITVKLSDSWGDEQKKQVQFPTLLRIGKNLK